MTVSGPGLRMAPMPRLGGSPASSVSMWSWCQQSKDQNGRELGRSAPRAHRVWSTPCQLSCSPRPPRPPDRSPWLVKARQCVWSCWRLCSCGINGRRARDGDNRNSPGAARGLQRARLQGWPRCRPTALKKSLGDAGHGRRKVRASAPTASRAWRPQGRVRLPLLCPTTKHPRAKHTPRPSGARSRDCSEPRHAQAHTPAPGPSEPILNYTKSHPAPAAAPTPAAACTRSRWLRKSGASPWTPTSGRRRSRDG